jgi:hypothetical protein
MLKGCGNVPRALAWWIGHRNCRRRDHHGFVGHSMFGGRMNRHNGIAPGAIAEPA